MREKLILQNDQIPLSKVNLLKKVISIIYNVFFVAVIVSTIIFIIIVGNERKNGGNFSLGRYSLFNIVSGSMEPKLPVGSTVISKKVDGSSIKKSDIISFKSGSIIISHRVFDIYTQDNNIKVYTTKGDANKSVDNNPVFNEQIIGKVINVIPKLGYILSFLTTKKGMLTIVIVPLFVIFLYDIICFFIELNKYLECKETYNN